MLLPAVRRRPGTTKSPCFLALLPSRSPGASGNILAPNDRSPHGVPALPVGRAPAAGHLMAATVEEKAAFDELVARDLISGGKLTELDGGSSAKLMMISGAISANAICRLRPARHTKTPTGLNRQLGSVAFGMVALSLKTALMLSSSGSRTALIKVRLSPQSSAIRSRDFLSK